MLRLLLLCPFFFSAATPLQAMTSADFIQLGLGF
jgi:hypothetical protein